MGGDKTKEEGMNIFTLIIIFPTQTKTIAMCFPGNGSHISTWVI